MRLLVWAASLFSITTANAGAPAGKTAPGAATPAPAGADLYSHKLINIDGKEVNLADYKGKTLLIVNTASKCGFTKQYAALEAIYTKYKSQNFVVLGFPSNDFLGQEPGTNEEIKKFCTEKFNVDFPMFAKGPVKGDAKQPLFVFLTQNAPSKGEIKWNFEKFLVSPDGQIVGRFGSSVTPDSKEMTAAIEKVLTK